MHQFLYVIPFLNKTSLSKCFCLLGSGFQRAIYDASKFFLVLAFFGAFEMENFDRACNNRAIEMKEHLK